MGLQAFLKMLINDNFIHADLHPGNVLIRFEELGLYQRLQRWVIFGDSGALAPHMVFLDAGLAASFNDRLQARCFPPPSRRTIRSSPRFAPRNGPLLIPPPFRSRRICRATWAASSAPSYSSRARSSVRPSWG